MKLYLLFFVIVFSTTTQAQTGINIKLDYLKSVPKEIDGCSGLYTFDSVSLKTNRYIFASDLQELAFISIGGKQIKLSKLSEKEISSTTHRTIFSGAGYTVTLMSRTIRRTGDELTLETGTIEIRKGKGSAVIHVTGEAGC